MKRSISLILALTLCLGGVIVPAQAAGGFTDISDPALQQAAELLAELGLMEGVGGGRFNPGGTLDRAMLAAIGARIAGVTDVSIYTSTVRFPDVRSGHWAHGWVMAAVDKQIMVGQPDGTFNPGGRMEFRFLITVLMRLLGYKDGDVGPNWPDSYINKAKAIGLTDGTYYTASYVLTRGQTALLLERFVNTKHKDGGKTYLEEHDASGNKSEGVLLLQTIEGIRYFKTADGSLIVNTQGFGDALDGQFGTFSANDNGQVLSFAPSADYSYKRITVDKLYDSHMRLTDGTVLPVASSTKVLTYGQDAGTYSGLKSSIWPGESLMLAYKGATLQYMYRDAGEHKDGAHYVYTCLRFLQAGTQLLAIDNAGSSYLTRATLSKADEGKTGRLLIDSEMYAASFVADAEYSYRSLTVKKAKAGSIDCADGSVLVLGSTIPVYSAGDSSTYGSIWQNLPESENLTAAYSANGLLAYLYRPAPLSGEDGDFRTVDTILRTIWLDDQICVLTDKGDSYPLGCEISKENYGKRGTLVLDSEDRVTAFSLSAASKYQSVSLQSSQAGGITDSAGQAITVLANTAIWDADSTGSRRYHEIWLDLKPGETLLIAYKSNGTMDYIYRPGALTGMAAAIVTLMEAPENGVNPLTALFGTVTAQVMKNGCPTSWKTLERYDVISYYPAADVALVSNLRFLGRSDARPSFQGDKPTISISGESFTMTQEAATKALGLSVGNAQMYLLDSQGRIADILSSGTGAAFALSTTQGLEITGAEHSIAPSLSFTGASFYNGADTQGLLGIMASQGADRSMGIVPYIYQAPKDSLNPATMMLGGTAVASWCRIFEQGGDNGSAMEISWRDLGNSVIPAEKIRHAVIGPSGYVTMILLQDVTYDCYDYGLIQTGDESTSGGDIATNYVWVRVGAAKSTAIPCGSMIWSLSVNSVGGIAPGRGVTGSLFLGGTVTCKAYRGLGRYDFTSDGYAVIEGKRVPLATQSVAYLGETISLESARANGLSITAYTDPGGMKVRYLRVE